MYTQNIFAQSDFSQSDMSQYSTTGIDSSYAAQDQVSAGVGAGLLVAYVIILVIVAAIMIPSLWKIFKKAGRPGWNALVPVYNNWVLLELGGKPGWWALVAFIPIVGLASVVFSILATIELAKRFGKSDGFAVLMILLPLIAYPILAFGKATYNADRGTNGPTPGVGDTPYPTSGQPQQFASAPAQQQPLQQSQQPVQPQQQPPQPPQPPSNLVQ